MLVIELVNYYRKICLVKQQKVSLVIAYLVEGLTKRHTLRRDELLGNAGLLRRRCVDRNTRVDDHALLVHDLEVFDGAQAPVEVDHTRDRGGVLIVVRADISNHGRTLLFCAASELAQAVVGRSEHASNVAGGRCRIKRQAQYIVCVLHEALHGKCICCGKSC